MSTDSQLILEQTVTGEIPMEQFLDKVQADPELQEYVRTLIPLNVQADPDHPTWNKRSYNAYRAQGFDVIRMLVHINGFERSFGGNLNAYDTLSWAYSLSHPNTECTTIYYDLYGLYLDAVQDCFEGPEVTPLVEDALQGMLAVKPKTKRIKTAKEAIHALFHVSGNSRPHWIQGPEWPMGKNSPMKYLSRKRDGERVVFTFRDVDTGEIRNVEQFY